jgi:hypothetical protein
VTPLTGDRVAADQRFAAHDDAAAHTGAKDDAEHNLRARCRAIDRLRQRKTVGVVLDADRSAEARAQVAIECATVQAHCVRVLDGVRLARERTRHSNAYTAALAQLRFSGFHESCDTLHDRVVVM